MNSLLAEFGKKLAERWATLLVLPGLVYVGVALIAHLAGHSHALDLGRLVTNVQERITSLAGSGTAAIALVIATVLLGAAASGLAAQATGSFLERLWLSENWATWPAPFRRLAHRSVTARRNRWTARSEAVEQLGIQRRRALVAGDQATGQALADDLRIATASMARVAEAAPERPTWIGDKLAGVTARLDSRYLLDVPTVWPHIWLTMPEPMRTTLVTARDGLTRAAALSGWGVLYIALGGWWWPAIAIGTVTVAAGWLRARSSTTAYAQLTEATILLQAPAVADALGLSQQRMLNRDLGWALTCHLQGRPELYEQTKGQLQP